MFRKWKDCKVEAVKFLLLFNRYTPWMSRKNPKFYFLLRVCRIWIFTFGAKHLSGKFKIWLSLKFQPFQPNFYSADSADLCDLRFSREIVLSSNFLSPDFQNLESMFWLKTESIRLTSRVCWRSSSTDQLLGSHSKSILIVIIQHQQQVNFSHVEWNWQSNGLEAVFLYCDWQLNPTEAILKPTLCAALDDQNKLYRISV